MRSIELQPNQVFTFGEYEIGREDILNIYFRICDKGHRSDLPPSLVINKILIPENALENYTNKNHVKEFHLSIKKSQVDYLLIDGNHKTTSEVLCHLPLRV